MFRCMIPVSRRHQLTYLSSLRTVHHFQAIPWQSPHVSYAEHTAAFPLWVSFFNTLNILIHRTDRLFFDRYQMASVNLNTPPPLTLRSCVPHIVSDDNEISPVLFSLTPSSLFEYLQNLFIVWCSTPNFLQKKNADHSICHKDYVSMPLPSKSTVRTLQISLAIVFGWT